MPLGDISAFHEWIERDSPSAKARSVARTFVAEIGDEPWRVPSVPIAELSDQPNYEVRVASLPVEPGVEVHILFVHAYATGIVDLIDVAHA